MVSLTAEVHLRGETTCLYSWDTGICKIGRNSIEAPYTAMYCCKNALSNMFEGTPDDMASFATTIYCYRSLTASQIVSYTKLRAVRLGRHHTARVRKCTSNRMLEIHENMRRNQFPAQRLRASSFQLPATATQPHTDSAQANTHPIVPKILPLDPIKAFTEPPEGTLLAATVLLSPPTQLERYAPTEPRAEAVITANIVAVVRWFFNTAFPKDDAIFR